MDGKTVKILQGRGVQKRNVTTVVPLRKNSTTSIILWKGLRSLKASWNAVKSGNIDLNDPKCAGQCHQPLVEVNLFSILHGKLRSLDSALSLLYRLCAGVTVWGTSDKSKLPLVNQAKEHVKEHIHSKTGMLI